MLIKNKTVNIRITAEKYAELEKWAKKFNIKIGPLCLFIITERLTIYETFLNLDNHLKSLSKSKLDKTST
jgi:hypothetical protein